MEAAKGVAQYKRTNEMPLTWIKGVDRKIGIGTEPGLKYDVTEVVADRNQKIELTFNNNDDMLHNLVITQIGIESVDKVGDLALKLGLHGADLNYVPDTDLVLNHTGIVQPGTEEKIYFQIPSKPGEYRIVCTFPGHAASMRAKLIVK
jgi:azurin